jgi:glycosyltransferase involved in cell wall biosynthesis
MPAPSTYDLAVADGVAPEGDLRRAGTSICLNMIVRNEAHIVHEVLDAVAPYIDYWVIVDTGSDDDTPEVIRNHLAGLGIPGELHERPWRNFGHNRTEALELAQGHGDYIWVMDADDTIVGTIEFTDLTNDVYAMRIGEADEDNFFVYSRPMLFRDGAPVRYVGALHEYAVCEAPYSHGLLDGDYYVLCRHLGGREGEQKYQRDRDVLLAEVERNPDDTRSIYYLAQTLFVLKEFAEAQKWYARRAELGGYREEVFCAMFRIAQTMDKLGTPWPEVQDAYLRAWEFSPHRAEPLFYVGRHYRDIGRYRLGYLFSRLAAELPMPHHGLQVRADIYNGRALDDQAVCASWIGKKVEAFSLWRQLLSKPDLPDEDRQRISANRDLCVPEMIASTSPYPSNVIEQLVSGQRAGQTTATLVGQDRSSVERTLNSFLNSCLDADRISRFILFDTGLSQHDRAAIQERYGFLQFYSAGTEFGNHKQDVREHIDTRFWLDLGHRAHYFAPENLIGRLVSVFDAEEQAFQVGLNFADAEQLSDTRPAESSVRHTATGTRYVMSDTPSGGPAMYDLSRPEKLTTTLDEVICIAF